MHGCMQVQSYSFIFYDVYFCIFYECKFCLMNVSNLKLSATTGHIPQMLIGAFRTKARKTVGLTHMHSVCFRRFSDIRQKDIFPQI